VEVSREIGLSEMLMNETAVDQWPQMVKMDDRQLSFASVPRIQTYPMLQIQGRTKPEGSVGDVVPEGRAGTSLMSLVRFSTTMVSGEARLRSGSARKESGDEVELRRRLRAVCVLFLAARLAFGVYSYLTGGPPLAAGSWLLLTWLGTVWLMLRPVGGG